MTQGPALGKAEGTATASHAKSPRRKELRLATESTEGHGRERDTGEHGVVGGELENGNGLEGRGLTAKGAKGTATATATAFSRKVAKSQRTGFRYPDSPKLSINILTMTNANDLYP